MRINLTIEADSAEELLQNLSVLSGSALASVANTRVITVEAEGNTVEPPAADNKTSTRKAVPKKTEEKEVKKEEFKSEVSIDQLRELAGTLDDPLKAKAYLNDVLGFARLTELPETKYKDYFDELTRLKNAQDL